MDTSTTLILAACGLLAVVMFVLLLGAFLMYRMLRFNVVNALMGWFMRGDDSRIPEDPYATQEVRRRADQFRAKAEALDFDKTVQQYQRTQPPDITVTGSAQVAPAPKLEERPINTSSPLGGRIGRDGRVTGGTPGQVTDGDAPGGFLELPDAPTNRPLRKPRREPNPDEIFGGMLDEDGDGTIDF